MTKNRTIEIALSKAKLTKFLLFSILFLGVGIWMIIANPQTGNPLFNNPVVKGIASYGSVLMGLLGIYFFSKKIFDKKPGLIIDQQGICDNTGALSIGFIPWSDISGIYERSVRASIVSRQHFVTIGLCDPEKYIAREKSALKRKLMSANANSYGSPVHISANGLNTNHKELLQLITAEFAGYKNRQEQQSNG